MVTDLYSVENYTEDMADFWDDFVMNNSVNGIILQTRRFLNYHPKDRFMDASLVVRDAKKHIAAVIPACRIEENRQKIFFSHKGSTYGGIIIGTKYYCAHKVIYIIDAIESYLCEEGYNKIIYKILPNIFCKKDSDLLQYCLYYRKYFSYDELNLYIDYSRYGYDTMKRLAQGKRTDVHNCQKSGMELKTLQTDGEMSEFYDVLCETLAKYALQPVHSLCELILLKNEILENEIEFYGLFYENKLVAGSMMFYYNNIGVANTQYLCARSEYNKLSPMSYMYYCMIEEMRKKNFKKLSFGITSEHCGIELNYGLTWSKECFGSEHQVNKVYYKNLDGKKEYE